MNKDLQTAQIIISHATLSDIPLIQNIVGETWPVAYTSILGKAQVDYMIEMFYSKESLKAQMTGNHFFYIAFVQNQPVGFASFSNVLENIGKLQKLYVLPAKQKTGAGKALLQTIEKESKNRGAAKLQLNVNRQNIAKAFYEKNGFAIIEQIDINIGNGYFMNDYVMQKDL